MKKQFRIYRLLLGVALIAVLVCFAPDSYSQDKKENKMDSVMKEQFENMNWDKEYLSQGLVFLWDKYTAECKADTQQVKMNVYEFRGKKSYSPVTEYDFDLGFSSNYRGVEIITRHREITLKGFIEFLRRGAKSN